ncbi:MAG: redoxin family protein [Fibrobacterales bacterium]
MSKALLLIVFLVSLSFSKSLWVGVTFKTSRHLIEGKRVDALKVDKLLPQSDAINSGIEPGDLLIRVNGTIINGVRSVAKAIKGKKEGSVLTFTLIRENNELTKKLALTPRPDNVSQWVGSPIGSKSKKISGNFYAHKTQKQKQPKLTLLDFWATWCGPCRQTLPIVAELYKKYEPKGFETIGISTESLKTLQTFQSKHSAPYPLLNDASGQVSAFYGVKALPTLAFIDADGYIVKVFTGAPSKSVLESVIKKYLD